MRDSGAVACRCAPPELVQYNQTSFGGLMEDACSLCHLHLRVIRQGKAHPAVGTRQPPTRNVLMPAVRSSVAPMRVNMPSTTEKVALFAGTKLPYFHMSQIALHATHTAHVRSDVRHQRQERCHSHVAAFSTHVGTRKHQYTEDGSWKISTTAHSEVQLRKIHIPRVCTTKLDVVGYKLGLHARQVWRTKCPLHYTATHAKNRRTLLACNSGGLCSCCCTVVDPASSAIGCRPASSRITGPPSPSLGSTIVGRQ